MRTMWIGVALVACGGSSGHAVDARGATAIALTAPHATEGLVVGFQDGSGAWSPITPATPGHYAFTATQDRFAIATACLGSPGFVTVLVATIDDGTAYTSSTECRASETFAGTVANAGSGTVDVHWGDGYDTADGSGMFTATAVAGPHDVVAISHRSLGGQTTYDTALVQRDVAAGSAATIDFSAAVALEKHNVTVSGGSGLTVQVGANLTTAHGTSVQTSLGGATNITYLPSSMLVAEDSYITSVQAYDNTSLLVGAILVAASGADGAIDLSARAPATSVTVASRSPLVLAATWVPQSSATAYVLNVYDGGGNAEWLVTASPGAVEQAGTVALALPDLTPLALPAGFAFPAGSLFWTVYAWRDFRLAEAADLGGSFTPGSYHYVGTYGSVTP
ncbi:MAG: hypothetical protein JO257_14680 [Deltaproteobacteria bacterium]|nr:hypothetical protein [Deltaproteobacteria bacterium]